MSAKSASFSFSDLVLPSADRAVEVAKKVAPIGIATGLAGGGLAYIASQIAQSNIEKKKRIEADKGNTDVLTVTIPGKTARFNPAILRKAFNYAKYPVAGAAALGTGAAVAADINRQPAVPAPTNKGSQADMLWEAGLWVAPALATVALSAGAINSFTRNRRKAEAQSKLEKAKTEYGSMLGQSLTGPKVAFIVEHPTIEGLVSSIEERVSKCFKKEANGRDILAPWTSSGSALALLSAVVAHQYVYNRETAATNALKQTKVKPPKSIRIVTAPPALPAPTDDDKLASFVRPEAIEFLHKQAFEISFGEPSVSIPEPTSQIPGEKDPDSLQPKIEQIDGNTYVIHTANGPVTVNADDPQAKALLQKKKQIIAQQMAGTAAIV
jgi:hypothetical protein